MTQPASSDRARRFEKGARWIYAYRWLDRLLGLISIVVLARILVPEDFGLVAIAASYMAVLEGLSDFDVNKALIQIRDEDRDLYDCAWTLSLLRGVITSGLMLVIAQFVGDPRIAEVLWVLALIPLLNGLANPRFVMYERELIYSKLATLTVASKSVAFVVTVAIAVVYQSYWAIVMGMVAGAVASLLLTYLMRPFRPRPTFARVRDILAFSGWMSLATVVTTLAMSTDRIIVGRLVGIAPAGSYHMAQSIAVLPTRELIGPLQRILFPSFSEIAADVARLRAAVRELINIVGSICLPAGFGFALLANDFVPLVLGTEWLEIVPLLWILVPFLAVRAAQSMTLPCVMALGETRLLFRVSVMYALVHLPVFIMGAALYGLTGAIVAVVAAGVFYAYLDSWLLKRTLDLSLGEILRQVRRPLLAAGLMVATVMVLDPLLPLDLFSVEGSWVSLAVKLGAGLLVFPAALYGLWRREGRPPGAERRLLSFVGAHPRSASNASNS